MQLQSPSIPLYSRGHDPRNVRLPRALIAGLGLGQGLAQGCGEGIQAGVKQENGLQLAEAGGQGLKIPEEQSQGTGRSQAQHRRL